MSAPELLGYLKFCVFKIFYTQFLKLDKSWSVFLYVSQSKCCSVFDNAAGMKRITQTEAEGESLISWRVEAERQHFILLSYYLLDLMLMESQVKFRSPQNIS